MSPRRECFVTFRKKEYIVTYWADFAVSIKDARTSIAINPDSNLGRSIISRAK